MFEELGLNVAPQPDNGVNPRPDNRSGWLDGETPAVVDELLESAAPAGIEVRLWDPSSELRFRRKDSVPPRPDGAPNRRPPAHASPAAQPSPPRPAPASPAAQPSPPRPAPAPAGWGD